MISAFGQNLTAEEWAIKSICKVSAVELKERIAAGWPARDAITTKSHKAKRSSNLRGVSWHKNIGKWVAQIKIAGKVKFIGSFDNPQDAADAFDVEARKLGRETNS